MSAQHLLETDAQIFLWTVNVIILSKFLEQLDFLMQQSVPRIASLVFERTGFRRPGGASHETSAPASAMARLYVCAYLTSSVGHTMGCN